VTAENILAVPGNHDVPRGSPPSSIIRYEGFTDVWRKAGCVTPWLDGVDGAATDGGPHQLLSGDALWAVFPVNTCNWSHVAITLPEPLRSAWPGLPALLAGGDADKEKELRRQLDGLAQYDMARVSSRQLEVLRGLIEGAPQPATGRQLRIAVLHHHLRAPSLREELKAFADISNLEQVRGFLRDRGIAVVVHGHKHEHAVHFDHIYDQDEGNDHRTLVIAGATFEPGRENDAVRLIGITGMPNNPSITVEPIPVPRGGVDPPNQSIITRRIWARAAAAGTPIVIAGTKRRQLSGSRYAIDAISFYRAQEFARWWPINVAEVRHLQWEVCTTPTFVPGRITTIASDARTHSRSPTQVAMPIIDRWLDQAPERLYLLADALTHRRARAGLQREAALGWQRTLADLAATAGEFNPDGVPIAIEGLKVLASYLDASDTSGDAGLGNLVRVLQRLARHNEAYEAGDRSKTSFDLWAVSALESVEELRAMTMDRVGA
jgi:hypothetical protein